MQITVPEEVKELKRFEFEIFCLTE